MTILIMLLEILPCIFLAKLENKEFVKIVGVANCTLNNYPNIMTYIIIMKLLRPRVTHCYLSEEVLKDIETLDVDHENLLGMEEEERQSIEEGEAIEEQALRPSNRERNERTMMLTMKIVKANCTSASKRGSFMSSS